MVGSTPAMQDVYRRVQQAARSDATVLLTGETGSGKELVAKTIHELSSRREGPFVVVSCAELPENLIESELFGHARGSFTGAHHARAGLFEAAHGGTLLLDETSDASAAVQMRLLRVVEERQVRRVGEVQVRGVDVRLIAATQKDLKERMDAGKFREDLFYRLRVLTIPVPPLRKRRGDIPALASHYLKKVTGPGEEPQRLSPLALEALQGYAWPGNVRELLAVIDAARTVRSDGTISVGDLPTEVTASWSARRRVGDEASRILKALEEAGGRRGRAAEILGISRTTLWRRMADLGPPTGDVS